MKVWKNLLGVGVALVMCSGTAFSYCSSQYSCDDEGGYSDADSHPLRIVAYALHPLGFAAEWLISRPIHAVVSQPVACPVFGYAPSPWGCEDEFYPKMRQPSGISAGPSVVTPAAPAPAVSAADLEAMRRAVDEAKLAAQEAKRAAEEAAQAAERSTKAFEKQLQK
jgi:hypothetical protein